uniref:Ycf13 n=1 Tax=Monomorphina parapyrum TaxID=1664066 RepID=A0A0G3VGW7_9EUGL|nr:ycf13 [Monomorphina parapyrum]AKL78909.1 ycf13 [Monomorphina parapyrum]
MVIFSIYNKLSWEKSYKNISRIQKLLFKSTFVSNKNKCLVIQKLILSSNSARLLAIRQVTQVSLNKKIPGIDGKVSLSFNERFELNEYLKSNFNSWQPQVLRKVFFFKKDGSLESSQIPTIADRVWQCLISYAIEPVQEARFNPSSFGFRAISSIYDIQKVIFLNICKQSFGTQKRVLLIDLINVFNIFNLDYLVNKLVAPRGIKLGIFRLLNFGFKPRFPLVSINQDPEILASLFANILLDGVENVHSSVRFGSKLLIFLKPLDNESFILNKVKLFLDSVGLCSGSIDLKLFSTIGGFDFLDWHFKVYKSRDFSCTPSFQNYQSFLKRIKYIINNSNYGSVIKANKLFPIIRDWKIYHKFCDMSSAKFSLFFVQKRAFKIFRKESKNDSYSAKSLIKKCFFVMNTTSGNLSDLSISTYAGHVCFWLYFSPFKKSYFCIHCGMKL